MPSSISNSEPVPAGLEPPYQRPLPALAGALATAVLTSLLLLGVWEAWVRSEQVTTSIRNSDGLWAEQRRRIDRGEGDGWVLIGSSRTLFDLQLDAWERVAGRRPIQLALEGTSPVTVLEGLADDPQFTGNLLVGVAPGLFFSGYEYRRTAIDRFATETPAQWFGQRVSLLLEPWLAFYEPDYALGAVLRRQPLSNRPGVEFERAVRKLSNMGRDRANRMWRRLETDPAYRDLARSIWADGWRPLANEPPEKRERILQSRQRSLDRALAATAKLRERGVTVVFVSLPYTGHYTVAEADIAPRAKTWDPLIAQSGALGLHFLDHPEMQGYDLPEWSHMSGAEADRFTPVFYRLLQTELAARAKGAQP